MIHETIESKQDQHALIRMMTSIYSSPITDEEIKEWKILYERLTVPSVPSGLRLIRTPPFCQQELDEWEATYQKIKYWNLEELAKRVVFERDEFYEPAYFDPEIFI